LAEHADTQVVREIVPHDEPPVCDAMESEKHRSGCRIPPCRKRQALEIVDEESTETFDGIRIAAAGDRW
jgi:hypothetical protein